MTSFDPDRYAQLLAEARPAVIDSEEEHDRMLGLAESLMEKGSSALTPEEAKLLELVVLLVQTFERSIDDDDDDDDGEQAGASAEPHETLQRLLARRGLEAADIAHFFGNPGAALDALSGRRPISRGQAKELSKFFRMPAKLFLR